ncbi:Uncharacterized membrane protein [Haladaptatus litoreus]|uniref:Uncharacterized membrane protein n=1 Tax=Haladaptatus litoreus TaxID=553468 RepID=A0A1N7DLF6_9EURY|nr:DUF1616 domain-containing protein [Haladaptatus litoreus]SIR76666.1 Uncharacterized membrane protein [Haladaptatus litoreus]
MTRDVDPKLLLPRSIRRLPADLVAIGIFVILTIAVVFIPGLNKTPLRAAVGLAFVLFPPGYAFIAALFPEGTTPRTEQDESLETQPSRFESGIDGLERVALSFGTSIAIVPLIGLILNFTPWGIRLIPIVVSISGFTLLMTAIAAVRRWKLPENERFSVPYMQWGSAARSELFEPDTRADAALNVILAISVILAAASVSYAVLVPNQGESFSEFYLLTENDDGELVADDYPANFTRGESKPVTVGIENHEFERTNYTAVALLQNVTSQNNSTVVRNEQELQRFQTSLEHNQTWQTEHNITATMTGTQLRLIYLLYKGDVPQNPTADNAYRELHLWVNVTANGTAPAQTHRGPSL